MLKKTGISLILLILLLWGMEKGYDYFLLHNPNLKSSYVITHQINADVLFLGPCETLWMMDPALFQKYTGLTAYNLATVHASFAENEVMLELYLKKNKTPKYIFLYVTGESVDGGYNVFNTYNFSHLLSDTSVVRIVKQEDPGYFKWTSLPFLKYAYYNDYVNFNVLQGLKHSLQGRQIAYFGNGYVPPHGISWDGRLEQFEQAWPKGRSFCWNPKEEKALQELISRCKSHCQQLILYESPMINEVKPYLKNREEIRQKITTLAGQNQVPYWVFDTMKIADSRKYFFSILNTNDQGSAIFNKTFADYFNTVRTSPEKKN
jgi:hypothetical protein